MLARMLVPRLGLTSKHGKRDMGCAGHNGINRSGQIYLCTYSLLSWVLLEQGEIGGEKKVGAVGR